MESNAEEVIAKYSGDPGGIYFLNQVEEFNTVALIEEGLSMIGLDKPTEESESKGYALIAASVARSLVSIDESLKRIAARV